MNFISWWVHWLGKISKKSMRVRWEVFWNLVHFTWNGPIDFCSWKFSAEVSKQKLYCESKQLSIKHSCHQSMIQPFWKITLPHHIVVFLEFLYYVRVVPDSFVANSEKTSFKKHSTRICSGKKSLLYIRGSPRKTY